MKSALLFMLMLLPSSASAQMPEPWVEHAFPARFGQLYALACADEAAFGRSWQGPVARLEASGWTSLDRVPGPGRSGSSLWVDRAGSELFTSTRNAIVHYRDGEWTRFEAPLGLGYSNQIVSFDSEHALTVGRARVVGWNGAAYAAYDPGTWRDLRAIAGTAEDDLWVGGQRGAVSHFDGETFERRNIETEGAVTQLWLPSADEAWAVVEHPAGVFHWDGERWSDRSPSGENVRPTGVGGNAANIYAVGNFGVVRWQDDRWRDVYRFEFDEYSMPRFRAVCATRTHVIVAEMEDRAWMRELPE